ncbi:MAG: hypothetical protein AAF628_19450 [Planctomycetota bacterium]
MLLRDVLLPVLRSQGDFDVTPVSGGWRQLQEALVAERPDVVILGEEPEIAIADVLESVPRLKVFQIRGDGRDARVFELEPRRRALRSPTPEGLVDQIRSTTRAALVKANWIETADESEETG